MGQAIKTVPKYHAAYSKIVPSKTFTVSTKVIEPLLKMTKCCERLPATAFFLSTKNVSRPLLDTASFARKHLTGMRTPKMTLEIAPKLKIVRVPIDEAMSSLLSMELLLATPSELFRPESAVECILPEALRHELATGRVTASVMPEPFYMPTSDERLPGLMFKGSRLATPIEAYANKRLALNTDPGVADDRAHTSLTAPLDQCKIMAKNYLNSLNAQYIRSRNNSIAREEEEQGVPEEDKYKRSDSPLFIDLGTDTPAYFDHVHYRLEVFPDATTKTVMRMKPKD